MESQRAEPDLREQVIERLHRSALGQLQVPTKRKIFLAGARGFGKSLVLERLEREIKKQEPKRKVRRLQGRNWPDALKELRRLAELLSGEETLGEKLPDLLFDDLDSFIQLVDTLRQDRCEQMIRDLHLVVSTLAGRDRRCVVTSTLSQSRFQDFLLALEERGSAKKVVVQAASLFFAGFDSVWLDPWQGDWKGRVRWLVKTHLPSLSPGAKRLSESVIVELTGGHPALLARAFEHLARELTSKGALLAQSLTSEGADLAELERNLRKYLEDSLLQQGMGSLHRALARLESSEDPGLQAAYADLLAFARDDTYELPAQSRDILLGEGLLFRDPASNTYRLPGELFRRQLVLTGKGALTVELVPTETEPHRQGIVSFEEGARRLDLELSGGSWRVLQVLFDEAPRFVSLKELQEHTHLTTDNAVRSAIQRLSSELRTAGIEGLVENQYGKGYRKGESPSWTAKGRGIDRSQPPTESS